MNAKANYRVFYGHYDFLADEMSDEQVVIIENEALEVVFSECEKLARNGFDITCEKSADGIAWEHAFCLNADTVYTEETETAKENENRTYQIYASEKTARNGFLYGVAEDSFGRPICHTFIQNYTGLFEDAEKIALRIYDVIDSHYTVVISDMNADWKNGENIYYIF